MHLFFRSRVNFLQQVVAPTPLVMAQYQRLDEALDDATARMMGLDLFLFLCRAELVDILNYY
jgi:hypothetical protein